MPWTIAGVSLWKIVVIGGAGYLLGLATATVLAFLGWIDRNGADALFAPVKPDEED